MNSDRPQRANDHPDGTTKRFVPPDWLLASILVAAVFLAYQPAWRGLTIWDDGQYITRARFASLEGLRLIWFKPGAVGQYYPLLHTAFWIQMKLWGGTTLGYHLVNIGCHAVGSLLILSILRHLNLKGAWFAAAIFALHPVHVESVAWISELKNTMSGVFFFAATLMYLRFDENRVWPRYAAATGLFLCALLSKATAAVWPIAMLIILWWKRGRIS